LECHHRKPDQFGINLADKPGDSLSHSALTQDKIGNGHSVILIQIACERSQSAIRHADRNSWHVLERIRHGEQKDVHRILIAFFDRIIGSGLLLASEGSHVPALIRGDVYKTPISAGYSMQ
jgi:hypothetical protein